MDPAIVRELDTPRLRALRAELRPYDEDRVLEQTSRLRGLGLAPDLVAALLTQARLADRATAKFGTAADDLLFTAEGLEQATRPQLAQRHAHRFVEAGVRTVWDLGCGIGSDALSLAAAGLEVVAVDSDPGVLAVAAANLAPWPGARTVLGDVAEVDPGSDAVWFDPARRTVGHADVAGRTRRSSRLEDLSPSWDHVQTVAALAPAAGAKLGPSFPHAALPAGSEAQWASFHGELLECVVWWGAAVRCPGPTAAVHTPDGWEVLTGPAGPGLPLARAGDVPGWLYEPDRAVLRAGLAPRLRELLPDAATDDTGGYAVSHVAADVTWARRWRVLEVLPLRTTPLRAWARSVGVGPLTVKRRGPGPDPERLRRDLRLTGDVEATVVVASLGGRTRVLHVEPG